MPAAPTGLVGSSEAYLDADGAARGLLRLQWHAVDHAAPGEMVREAWVRDGAERVLADTDKYLTFPGVTRLASGRLVAMWSAQDDHYTMDVAHVVHSDDEGKTWSEPVVPVDHATYARGAVAVASLGNRAALLLLHNDPPGRRGWVYVSSDPGSWSGVTARQVDYGQGAGQWVFPAGLTWIADGSSNGLMIATAYGSQGCALVRSTDAGVSWSAPSIVAPPFEDGYSEPWVTHLGGDEMLLFVRYEKAGAVPGIFSARSTDKGLTWSPLRRVLSRVASLPSATMLPNGVLVMPVRDMTEDDSPQSFSLAESRDRGQSWTMRPFSDDWMMYGQVVPLADGERALLIGAHQDRTSSTNADVFVQDLRWPVKMTPGTGGIEIDHYEVALRENVMGAQWASPLLAASTSIEHAPVPVGSYVQAKVRAIGKYTVTPGLWSKPIVVRIEEDVTPPPRPSNLVGSSALGVATWTLDGLTYLGT
ncbi:MAG: sialidase family protein, partial [Propionibacteriaceae bacterium]|nr:sialidase family protein [Propionibacteriaceae bacterium]